MAAKKQLRATGLCSVRGCIGAAEKRGWCGAHYYRWRVNGDLQENVPVRKKPPAGEGVGRTREYKREWARQDRKKNPDRWRYNNAKWAAGSGRVYTQLANERRRATVLGEGYEEWLDIISGDPCSYCGKLGVGPDHIVPVSSGGSFDWDNIAPACESCNKGKRDKSLLTYLLDRG